MTGAVVSAVTGPQPVALTALGPGGSLDAPYVSPGRDGGYCYVWRGHESQCQSRVARLGLTWGRDQVFGTVAHADISSVTIEFTDGTSVRPSIAWFAAPINAGFFVYRIPAGKTVSDVIAAGRGGNQACVPWYAV